MSESPLEPPDGLESLDQLSRSFARLFGGELPDEAAPPAELAEPAEVPEQLAADEGIAGVVPTDAETYEVTPQRLLEAMLFVGSPDSQPS